MVLSFALFLAQEVFAASYLTDIELNTGTQSISGSFQKDTLFSPENSADESAGVHLELSDGLGNIVIVPGAGPNNSLVYNEITGDFSVPFGEIYTTDSDATLLIALSGQNYDRLQLVWKTLAGDTMIADPIFMAGKIVEDVPVVDGGVDGMEPPVLDGIVPDVRVNWDKPVLKNTKGDKSGVWYYEIRTTDNVVKSADGNVYLVMAKIENGQTETRLPPIVLGEYPAGDATSFPVLYPSCVELNCPTLTGSPIEPGFHYEVYFSSLRNGLNMIHDDVSSQKLLLDSVPDNVVEANANQYIRIDNPQWAKSAEDGALYIDLSFNVLRSVTGGYNLIISAQDTDGSRKDVEYNADYFSGNIGLYHSPENLSYKLDSSYDNYQIQVLYDGNVIKRVNMGSAKDAVASGDDILLSSSYTKKQQDIIDSGIVPTDCGYDVGPEGNGHICGFADIIRLIQNIIEYIFILILPIAAIVFAYAGFLLLTSGGSPEKRKSAKNAMVKVITGIIIILLAWLLVKTVLVGLGASAGFTMFLDLRS